MENNEQDHLSDMGLQVDTEVRQQLSNAGYWAKFISVLVFVCCGILLIVGIAGADKIMEGFRRVSSQYRSFSDLEGGVLIGIIIFAVLIMVVLYYFLFNFSVKIKNALIADNTSDLNNGLKSLKIYFIITTILAILSLINNLSNLF